MSHVHGQGDSTESKCRFSPSWSVESLKFQYSVGVNRLVLKYLRRDRRPRAASTGLKGKTLVGGLTLPAFRIYSKATAIKTVWCSWNNRQTDQWSRTVSPETDLHKHCQPISDRGAKTVSSANVAQTTGHPRPKPWIWTQTFHPSQKLTQNRT